MYHLKIAYILSILTLTRGHGLLQILQFGGNGFLGSHTTLALLGHQSRMLNITVVSRGSWPFDTAKSIEPYVFHVSCDRYDDNGLLGCPEFRQLANSMEFDAVVDFSAYEPRAIRDAVAMLKQRAGLYIYISSDSVYEVSQLSSAPKSTEDSALRPTDTEEAKRLAEADSYGDEKLSGEEMLTGQPYVPYIILRLPDILGSRDTTYRWWPYMLRLQHHATIQEPIPIPSRFAELSTSYVYAADVGQLIADIIFGRFSPEINNQIYNLGFEEGRTLQQVLRDMADMLGVDKVEFEIKEGKEVPYLLPSVTRGEVDISKAKKYLNFKPTPWKEALKETMNFFKLANRKFPKERERAVKKFLTLGVSEEKQNQLRAELGIKSQERESHVEL